MADRVVTTGAVALGAFLLATARDEHARYRDGRQKDSAVLTAVADEFEANPRIARDNREIIRDELAAPRGAHHRA